MTLDTIMLIAMIALAIVGLIIGLAKGFTKLSTWLLEIALATATPIVLFKYVEMDDGWVKFGVALGGALAVIILAKFLLHCWKNGMKKNMKKTAEYNTYKNYEKDEEIRDEMRDAAAEDNKKQYRKNGKKLRAPSTGAAGIGNRVIGALLGAVEGAALFMLLAGVGLFVMDMLQLEGMEEMLAPVMESELWLALKGNVFDAILVVILYITVVQGFQSGLFEKLWGLASVALVAGAAFFAYTLAFGESFTVPAQNFAAWLGGLEFMAQVSQFVDPLLIAQIVLTVVLFLVLLIPCILVIIFVPKLLEKVRQTKWFYAVDGVLGAVTMLAIVFGLLMVVGMILSMISELEAMQAFGSYLEGGVISKFFYTATPLKDLEFYGKINEWFGILRGEPGPTLG